jgi:enoyl-[acyl-carrier protein] reductase I
VRSNLVSAGPIKSIAAGSIPGFELLAGAWHERAPLPWDTKDAGPVADACLFLMSGLARGVTGEILHVDGGYHALGAPLAPPPEAKAEVEVEAEVEPAEAPPA